MLKKTGMLSTCYSFSLCPHSASISTSSSTSHFTKPQKHIRRQERSYAQVYHDPPRNRDEADWPVSHQTKTPTPYEIFHLDKSAAYSKIKFYQLVKLYHPDRLSLKENHRCRNLPPTERMERYRLIVLAHEILSDPTKRKAYDNYGTGWVEGERADSHLKRGRSRRTGKPFGRGKDFDESPFANATWEDWERWYRHEAGETPKEGQSKQYMNPNILSSCILLIAIASGITQANQAASGSSLIEKKALAFTEETHGFLNARSEALRSDHPTSLGRVKWFLERRDPSKAGLKEEEEDLYRDHFMPSSRFPVLPDAKTEKPPDAPPAKSDTAD